MAVAVACNSSKVVYNGDTPIRILSGRRKSGMTALRSIKARSIRHPSGKLLSADIFCRYPGLVLNAVPAATIIAAADDENTFAPFHVSLQVIRLHWRHAPPPVLVSWLTSVCKFMLRVRPPPCKYRRPKDSLSLTFVQKGFRHSLPLGIIEGYHL